MTIYQNKIQICKNKKKQNKLKPRLKSTIVTEIMKITQMYKGLLKSSQLDQDWIPTNIV